ncbi:MAG: hypothetical protein GOVbin1511_36 [Prokaryotic dsDNA virus sp.]|nr:MAG: hypothetical protein GOVbin1511_36 [Prokaryotic dsDNA virus sp.]
MSRLLLALNYKQETFAQAHVGEMMGQGEDRMIEERYTKVMLNLVPKECRWCGSKIGFLYNQFTPPVCLNCSMEHKIS